MYQSSGDYTPQAHTFSFFFFKYFCFTMLDRFCIVFLWWRNKMNWISIWKVIKSARTLFLTSIIGKSLLMWIGLEWENHQQKCFKENLRAWLNVWLMIDLTHLTVKKDATIVKFMHDLFYEKKFICSLLRVSSHLFWREPWIISSTLWFIHL